MRKSSLGTSIIPTQKESLTAIYTATEWHKIPMKDSSDALKDNSSTSINKTAKIRDLK